MPILNTKYNKISKLHNDLSSNSFVYNNYILTCDLSDTNMEDINNKIYLNSKAEFLMHPFSRVRNCVNKFNNEKESYRYKENKCLNADNLPSSSIDISSTQKIIQKTVRVDSSLYTDNLASLHISNNKTKRNDVSIKHDSYSRYIGKKKEQHLKSDKNISNSIILYGNKNYKFGIINCKQNC